MARIVVRREAFERGEFPPVCCKTGVPASTYTRWKFVQTPAWTWILLPFGFVPFVIARLFAAKEFEGVVPITRRAERRVRVAARVSFLLVFVAAGLLLGGLVAWGWAVGGLVAAGAAAVTMIACMVLSPDAHNLEDGSVELRNVHPGFVRVITEATQSS